MRELFLCLDDIAFTHRWGGPVSVPVDMAPAIGYIGADKSTVYSMGCMGNGVSLTRYMGWTLAELLLEQTLERMETFFVNRKTIPWPSEPLRFVAGYAIRGYMRLEDKWYDPKVD
ncbi:MAG: hypothetical protein ISR95_08215 [Candidatus Marinimicrobia bacterium]|nr:hypothetical protein [Candidatus Neomarinimicrobiota bacterium]